MNTIHNSVSVIIPTFNRSEKLLRAIASVRSQTYSVHEIIVVDDGSTDDTQQAVSSLDDKNIIYIKQTNSGANVARNNGVSHATGHWVSFLDSDDTYLPERLERQIKLLDRSRDLVGFCGAIVVDDDGNQLYNLNTPSSVSITDICGRNLLGSTSTAIVDRNLMKEVGGFDEALRSCQDWELYIRLRLKTNFSIITQPLILYENGGGERISNNMDKVIEGHYTVFSKAIKTLGRNEQGIRHAKTEHNRTLATIYRWHHKHLNVAKHTMIAAAYGRKPYLVKDALRSIFAPLKYIIPR